MLGISDVACSCSCTKYLQGGKNPEEIKLFWGFSGGIYCVWEIPSGFLPPSRQHNSEAICDIPRISLESVDVLLNFECFVLSV